MIRLRELRVWTALLVIGLSTIVLRLAATVLAFGCAETFARPQSVEDRLQSFVAVPIVASLARRDLLRLAPPADATTRVEDLSEFLTQRPLASGAWLDLSAAKIAANAGPDEVAASLALSNLTGPNEAYLMAARAAFALPLWASLPPDSRRSVIGDVVGGWLGINESNRVGLKAALERASGKTREEVRAALLLAGKRATEIEKVLDLKSPPVLSDDKRTSPLLMKPGSAVAPSAVAGSPGMTAQPSSVIPPVNQFSRDGSDR